MMPARVMPVLWLTGDWLDSTDLTVSETVDRVISSLDSDARIA